jgi:ABC-type nitrate/sulfonate/bicarbonate transport system substrate-binding protein
MFRRYFHWIAAATAAILVLVVILVAHWRNTAEERVRNRSEKVAALSKARVAMKWTWAGTMAPYFAARKNHLFEEHGLSVELLPGGQGKPSTEQVLFGRADFGITGAHDLALARAKAQPLVSVAVIFKQSPTCLISLTSRGIRTPVDLRGKVVEMTADDNSAFEYRAMLERNGVPFADVKTRNYNYNYDALLSGQVDATVAYENDQAITLASDAPLSILSPRHFRVTPYADVLFTTEETIRNNPELVGKVVSGFLAAWDWAASNRDSTVSLFLRDPEIKPLGLKAEEQLAVLNRSVDFVRGGEAGVTRAGHIDGLGMQDLARWEETVTILNSYREILLGGTETRWQIPDPRSCFTNRWVELYAMHVARQKTAK